MSGGVGPVVDWSPAGSRKTAALHGALARMLPARAGQFARIALAFALIALLFHFGAIDAGNVVAVLSSPGILLLAVLGNLVIVHVAIAKWDLLLRLQGVRIPFVRLWRITFIAMFTGSFFPGGVGQDAVRVFCAAREPECSFGQALTSVVADRLLGLTGLLIAATIFVLIKEERVMSTPALRALAIFVFGATMATLVLLGGVAALGYRPSVRRRLRMFLGAKGPAARVIGPLVEAGRAYGDRLWGVLAALAISVIVHLLTASVLILLAEPIELRGLGRLDIALATALASLANAIPLTPGGLGIGEGAFAEICRMLSTAPDAGSYGSTFFLARAVTTFVSLIGAVSYVWRSEERTPRQAREYEGVEDRSPCAEADDGRSPSGPHGAGTGSVSLSIDGRVRSSER
ncbi:MAG: lysylphosphatidylglycerol synthase transmembrane domain-containing protein [Roseiarcus sp.]|jgi:uncharacterized protein (TIRG00374 family)